MPTLATRSSTLDRWALSLLSPGAELLRLARRVAEATAAPVIGGISVFLHGYRRTTEDIDLFAADTTTIAEAVRGIGGVWNEKERQLELSGMPIHLVTEAQTGGPPVERVVLQGVPTVGLADLVRFTLHSGLDRPDRAQDLADVVELIRRVPLTKRFAAQLPSEQRAPFRKLVDAVESA
ncbi:MAG TPA: hypothetical protein VMT85_09455 [Thermoanaerobaculia bacterium]|nr:hypothetical protein [Thermoanaerobaculia bacterium]